MSIEDLAHQARSILGVYLERSQAVLAALAAERDDEAEELIRRQNEAFHNFRAVDALALAAGVDLAGDEAAQDLWKRCCEVQSQLSIQLVMAHERTAELAKRLREARQKLSGYRSGTASPPGFEQPA